MLNKRKKLYSLKDVAIMPAAISEIEHRSECKTHYEGGKLPIFTAPMPCVVDSSNYEKFEQYGINAILPRTENIGFRLSICDKQWCAFSLDEFEQYFINEKIVNSHFYVLIDIANGNMKKLYDMSKSAKEYYGGRISLMVGNIANPETFRKFCEIGIDYVRCSVGSGMACTTSTNLGILYPMASLIDECFRIKLDMNSNTKIIADGGISSYRRMIKALALGADYIMLGSTLNKLEDSAGEIITRMAIDEKSGHLVETKFKEYYGMASEKGMKLLGKTGTPEGKMVYNRCNGTIESFTNEFIGYLKSAMSYCNINDIEYFVGGPELNILSENASNQFNQSR